MPRSLFNSDLELAARITTILAERPHLARCDRQIEAIDLLTTNHGDFNAGAANLHGHLNVPPSYATRLAHIQRAMKFVVTRGLAVPVANEAGLQYRVTDNGRAFARALHNTYLNDYRHLLGSAFAYVDSHILSDVLARVGHESEDEGVSA